MDDKTKNFLATTTSGISVRLFTRDIDEMDFTEQVLTCSALQVIEKYTKERRDELRAMVGERIDNGDTNGVPVVHTENGNPKVVMDDVSCYVNVTGGGRKVDAQAVLDLLDDKGIDPHGTEDQPALVEPEGRTVNEAKFFELLDAYDSDDELTVEQMYEACVEPKKYAVNEAHLWALTRVGVLEVDELNACYDEVPERRSVRCTFDRDTKNALLENIRGSANQIEE